MSSTRSFELTTFRPLRKRHLDSEANPFGLHLHNQFSNTTQYMKPERSTLMPRKDEILLNGRFLQRFQRTLCKRAKIQVILVAQPTFPVLAFVCGHRYVLQASVHTRTPLASLGWAARLASSFSQIGRLCLFGKRRGKGAFESSNSLAFGLSLVSKDPDRAHTPLLLLRSVGSLWRWGEKKETPVRGTWKRPRALCNRLTARPFVEPSQAHIHGEKGPN
jgi:hypothetical protein